MLDDEHKRDLIINQISMKLISLYLQQVRKILQYTQHFQIIQGEFIEPRICGLLECNNVIPEFKTRSGPKQDYCTNAHKQKAYRQRKKS